MEAETYVTDGFPDLEREPQSTGHPGNRPREAFAGTFEAGASAGVVNGSEPPTLPISHLQEGVTATRKAADALGPAGEGGYYLIGSRHDLLPAVAGVFFGIPRSTGEVLEISTSRTAAVGLKTRVLPRSTSPVTQIRSARERMQRPTRTLPAFRR